MSSHKNRFNCVAIKDTLKILIKPRDLEFSSAEWARKLDITDQAINGGWLKKGPKASMPGADKICMMCSVGDISPLWFFFREGPKSLSEVCNLISLKGNALAPHAEIDAAKVQEEYELKLNEFHERVMKLIDMIARKDQQIDELLSKKKHLTDLAESLQEQLAKALKGRTLKPV